MALILSIFLLLACSLLGSGIQSPTMSRPGATPTPPASRVTLNYSAADVDRAEALWNGKRVNTYQTEVWAGAVTPPPPAYIVQVWKDQAVWAAQDTRMSERTPRLILIDPTGREAQDMTVRGLFAKVRDYLSPAQTGQSGQASVEFDKEWSFPRKIGWRAECIDCVWFSQVLKFAAFDSAAPPSTPTRQQGPIPEP